MLFVHRVRPQWRDRIPAVVHVDGTARIQTVDDEGNAGIAALCARSKRAPACPVLVNTSLNTAGDPMVDDPRDALELFGSAPVDAWCSARTSCDAAGSSGGAGRPSA
jgi:carbamoyltransferase